MKCIGARHIDKRAQDIAPLRAREMGNDACKINPVGAQYFAPAMKCIGARHIDKRAQDIAPLHALNTRRKT